VRSLGANDSTHLIAALKGLIDGIVEVEQLTQHAKVEVFTFTAAARIRHTLRAVGKSGTASRAPKAKRARQDRARATVERE